jgi:excisionase family DNA binding protein
VPGKDHRDLHDAADHEVEALELGDVDDLPDVLNLNEAAAMLRIRPRTLSGLAQTGEVPGRKLGKAWRFSRQGLDDWLSHRAYQSPPGPAARRAEPADGS